MPAQPVLKRLLGSTVILPTMPEVARQILSTFGRDTVTMAELLTLIRHDPSLVSRLLRLANSARYAPPQPVTKLGEAAMMIGLNALRSLALGCCLADAFPNPPGFDRLRLWRQNLGTAGFARWLALHQRLDHDSAEVAGLLLRCGQVLMLSRQPGLVALVEALACEPDSVFELERTHFGCTHAELSAELAERWRLPHGVIDALAAAHDPMNARPFSAEGAIVRAASVMADAADDGLDPLDELVRHQPGVVQGMFLDIATLRHQLPDYARITDPVVEMMG